MTYTIDEENYMRRFDEHRVAVINLARATRAKSEAIEHEDYSQRHAERLAQWLEANKHLKPKDFPETENEA